MNKINLSAALGVAIREFPTSTGPVDYALFVAGKPVGVVEAKKDTEAQNITVVEGQSFRYANSTFKYLDEGYEIRFAYEATGTLTRFTDFHDIKYRSRFVFSFHQPETLQDWIAAPDTVRNNQKHLPELDTTGFRKCQEIAIKNLDTSFAENRPKALVQMATGAGKTFTAITESYRLLTYGKMNRILFLVDTKSLGVQAEQEFRAYVPNGEQRVFSDIFGVRLLKKSVMSPSNQVYISTIQRMYSILKGEELSEEDEEIEDEIDRYQENRPPVTVVYNKKYPPEFFDCIIVDECHRSIYNVWSQVLEYFDAFIIGLTTTPEKRTFAFFNQNVVSEYSREKAIIDRVNVGEDIYLINTEITQNGAMIMKRLAEYRDRLTRAKRWRQMDEDMAYNPGMLDVDVVNPSQIRAVIQTYRDKVFTELFPRRKNVPKTLIFAKNDSHADDIVQIVREVFGEGNEFCQKITCKAKKADEALSNFRNQFYPRIAVTVEMIATGTDVKPLECLIFMRDVRSKGHYEQMLGRGTRVLKLEDLKMVSGDDATEKDHFVVINAVGVTKSKKTEKRPLEYKPHVSLTELMKRASLEKKDPEILTSLANRLIRLSTKLKPEELDEFETKVGKPINSVAENLLNAFDKDVVAARAGVVLDPDREPTPEDQVKLDAAQEELIKEAERPFKNPDNRDYIEDVRKKHDQIIDNVNIDSVTYAGWDKDRESNADQVIKSFPRNLAGEVLVVDNDSTDRSAEIAEQCGARVIHEHRPGYGRALRTGLSHAEGSVIIFGDCDSTYDFLNLDPLYKPLARNKVDFMTGNRFGGKMEKGAMSFSHKIGVPFLSACGRVKFRVAVKDWHCGIRGIRKDALERIAFGTTGMEFATEMIAEASRKKLRIGHVTVPLKKAQNERQEKLRTVRDGFRHLFYIIIGNCETRSTSS